MSIFTIIVLIGWGYLLYTCLKNWGPPNGA